MGLKPAYSVCGNKQHFNDDDKLHRNIVHCVAHLLLSAQAPPAWIGNIKAGWADEGVGHWFEDRYFGICDNYCFQEANGNLDFKSGRFRLAVRKLVAANEAPAVAVVFEQNCDTLTLPMNAVAFTRSVNTTAANSVPLRRATSSSSITARVRETTTSQGRCRPSSTSSA